MTEPNPVPEHVFADYWANTILPPGTRQDVAHELFCAGWQALADRLGHDHYVTDGDDWLIAEHSVDCRLAGQMHHCAWHDAIVRAADRFDPAREGRWRITGIDDEGLPVLEGAPAGRPAMTRRRVLLGAAVTACAAAAVTRLWRKHRAIERVIEQEHQSGVSEVWP
jgi:hypothetical protein